MLARALLLGLLALASFSSRAWATGPAAYPPGGSGSGVVANTCSAGDFFSAVDGSGNFTCATPSGSGDVTAVGDCASGACFDGTDGNTLTAQTGSFVLNTDSNIYLSFDTDNNSTGTGVVIGSNASGSSATPWVVVSDAAGKNMTLRNATTLRINDPSDDTNYVEFNAPTIGSNVSLTLPTSGGTVPSSATAPVTLSAAGVVALTQNAGTDVTADLEEETHATEHSLGGADPITVTNLASACTDGQVLGGTAGGTGVECQADVDTNTNASTICAGTTTYLDGEGNCDDISSVYAPIGATFITQTASAALTGEQAMGSLGTGLVINTTTTGVQSIYAGASCTNQFPRALSASGAATCATVVLGTDTSGSYAAGDGVAGNATGLACAGSCVSDAEVDNGITASNYLPLTGGTLSGPLLVNSSITGSYGSSADAIDFSNTYTLSAGGQTINTIDISPTATLSTAGNFVRGLNMGGTYSVSSTVPLFDGINFSPTVDYSNTTDPFPVYRVSAGYCAPTFTSSTANGPLYQDCWVDLTTINYSGSTDVAADSSTGNPWAPIGLLQQGTAKTSGTGDLTINHYDGMRQELTYDAGNASSAFVINNQDVAEGRTPGCVADNCGPGTVNVAAYSLVKGEFSTALDTGLTITNAYGMKLESFDKATNNYSLYSDTATTLRNGGVGDFGDNIADLTTNTTSVLDVSPTVDISSTGTLNGFLFAPTTATSSGGGSALVYGVRQTPAMTFSSGIIPAYVALGVDGTSSSSAITTGGLGPIVKLLDYTATWGSSTASGIPVTTAITISDNPLITSTATSGSATVGTLQGMTHSPRVTLNDTNGATGGVTALTVTEDTAYNVAGTYTETSGDLVITARTGLKFNQYSTSGSPAVTAQYGVDIAALSGATTNVGIRNADTTVYTPCVDDISGNTDYMVAKSACTAINLTAGGVRDFTVGTDQIADGYDGQIIYLFFSGSNSVAFNDGDNVNLAAAGTMTMSAGDTLTLLFSSTRGEWLELGRADN